MSKCQNDSAKINEQIEPNETMETNETNRPIVKAVNIETWKELVEYFVSESHVYIIDDDGINYDAVVKCMDAYKYISDEVSTVLQNVPNNVAFKLWDKVFFARQPFKYDFELDGMSKEVKKQAEELKQNRRRYVSALTDYVLSTFRDSIEIDDKFIVKLFEHDLQQTLLFLLENKDNFKMKQETKDNMVDLYIMVSCDTNNIRMFVRLLDFLKIEHLEYAIRFASYDFLINLWKMRKWIPQYDSYMRTLDKVMKGKSWKQLQYFDWYWKNVEYFPIK